MSLSTNNTNSDACLSEHHKLNLKTKAKVDLTSFAHKKCKDGVTCGTGSEPNQFNWTFCQSASLKGHNQFREVGSIEAGSAGISDGHFSLGKEIAYSRIPQSPAHGVNYLIGLEAVMASEGQ